MGKWTEKCRDMVDDRASDSPCLVLAGDPVGNAPSRSSLLFGHISMFPQLSKHCFKKVFNNLLAFPKELPIPFRYCSNGLQECLNAFPDVSKHKFGHFLSISHETICFSIFGIRNQKSKRKF